MAAEVEGITPQTETVTERDETPKEEGKEDVDEAEEHVKEKKTTSKEPSKSEEKSGIRKRIKINLPGIISTDDSSHKPPGMVGSIPLSSSLCIHCCYCHRV